jgi:hypothetical protein
MFDLSRLFDKIREQNMVKSLPKPKTRPETDEEFQRRAFHTPIYCKECGSVIYPEWIPTTFSQRTGKPEYWENVQKCLKCNKLTIDYKVYLWQGEYSFGAHFSICRESVIIDE